MKFILCVGATKDAHKIDVIMKFHQNCAACRPPINKCECEGGKRTCFGCRRKQTLYAVRLTAYNEFSGRHVACYLQQTYIKCECRTRLLSPLPHAIGIALGGCVRVACIRGCCKCIHAKVQQSRSNSQTNGKGIQKIHFRFAFIFSGGAPLRWG